MSPRKPARPDFCHLELYKNALSDICNGKFDSILAASGQTCVPTDSKAELLRGKARKLQQYLDSNGLVPSAAVWAQLMSTVDEYFGLLGVLKEGETLAKKTVKVNFCTMSGTSYSMPDCQLGGNLANVRAAIKARVGSSGSQLLCFGRPISGSDEAQSLYKLATTDTECRGLRVGLQLQEVGRAASG